MQKYGIPKFWSQWHFNTEKFIIQGVSEIKKSKITKQIKKKKEKKRESESEG